MKTRLFIIFLLGFLPGIAQMDRLNLQEGPINFDFYGNSISLSFDPSMKVELDDQKDNEAILRFCEKLNAANYQDLIRDLLEARNKYKLDDWLYYQLIRRTAQTISPKADNYYRYTLYKWFFLTKSGYSASLKTSSDKLLFYVQTDENIYNIPFYTRNEKQYVCLNYHDYGAIDFAKESFTEILVALPENEKVFSYKITHLPDFNISEYQEKDLQFNYNDNTYHFKVKLNPQIKTIFANYPVVDYESYLNIPLSKETYSTLIPLLKKSLKGMSVKNGVDYLMRFTRYAFLFEPDAKHFGNEKRLSPEQTLLYEQSDCEDRVALFFCLVKEIYDLPMIVLAFPEHVTIAVRFDKPVGKPIVYNGIKYSVCEPTPQREDLPLGHLLPNLYKESYEVVYAYTPRK